MVTLHRLMLGVSLWWDLSHYCPLIILIFLINISNKQTSTLPAGGKANHEKYELFKRINQLSIGTTGQWKGNRKKLFFKISLITYWVEWDYRRSLLQCLLVPQTVLGSRETLKQIITRAGCWICLNIALNVGFTFWKYKHFSQSVGG